MGILKEYETNKKIMNEKKFLSYLNKYHSWLKEHKAKAEEEPEESEEDEDGETEE